jgi:hypothetical protein
MKQNYPTAIKGTTNLAKTSFSREIFAGAMISVAQYFAPLRYVYWDQFGMEPASQSTAYLLFLVPQCMHIRAGTARLPPPRETSQDLQSTAKASLLHVHSRLKQNLRASVFLFSERLVHR